jgi:hypothetical protein
VCALHCPSTTRKWGGLLFHELKARGVLDVGRFLIRRGFTIWLSYYVYLAVFASLRLLTGAQDAGAWDLLPNLLNVQNYFGSPRVHTWFRGHHTGSGDTILNYSRFRGSGDRDRGTGIGGHHTQFYVEMQRSSVWCPPN